MDTVAVQPRSGDRSVAHGVSHGIRGSRNNAAPEGRNTIVVVVMFRRSAAYVSIMSFTHGLRGGLQIFCRSAAGKNAPRQEKKGPARLTSWPA